MEYLIHYLCIFYKLILVTTKFNDFHTQSFRTKPFLCFICARLLKVILQNAQNGLLKCQDMTRRLTFSYNNTHHRRTAFKLIYLVCSIESVTVHTQVQDVWNKFLLKYLALIKRNLREDGEYYVTKSFTINTRHICGVVKSRRIWWTGHLVS